MKQSIIIVGAGIAGLSAAKALSQLPDVSVTLLDAKELAFDFSGVDARVSAITPKSKKFFESLGVWQAIESMRVMPYQKMHVWDEGSNGAIDFDAREFNHSDLGFMVENRVIRKALFDALDDSVELRFGVKLMALERIDNVVILQTDQGDMKASLLIGADGAQSWVRSHAGFECAEKPYGQSALVATIKTSQSNQHTAWQRFLKTGPLAFLPIVDEYTSSIVWSLDESVFDDVFALDDEAFMRHCSSAFNGRLGDVLEVSKRFAFPLTMRHVKSYVQPHTVLIGDAAHTIHPLAGQGLNLGLQDVSVLVSELKLALVKGRAVYDYTALRRYARTQKAANDIVLLLMRGFKELFSNDDKSASLLRSLGLKLFNRSKFLKAQVLKDFY